MHIEFLLEEPSAEAFLKNLIPKLLPQPTFNFHVFSGKPDLLKKLPLRLRAYRRWIPDDWRIVVLVDEDRKDCHVLKTQIEQAAIACGFATKTSARGGAFQVLNRIAIEELEAWFFGDSEAVLKAYPKVSARMLNKPKYQNSDAITGGTAEAFERILKRAGYYSNGMPKIEVATCISTVMDYQRNLSRSFQVFKDGLLSLA